MLASKFPSKGSYGTLALMARRYRVNPAPLYSILETYGVGSVVPKKRCRC